MSEGAAASRLGRIARRSAATVLLCLAASPVGAVPSFEAVKQGWRSSDWILLDRHGVPIQRLRADFGAWRGDWVRLEDVSPALREALLVSEDKRFYQHSGVDWRGVAAAAWANLWNTRTRGASTVTMQLAGLLSQDRRGAQRSVREKIDQTLDALALERSWRKDQILEAYLNEVPLRGEQVGIAALSETLFGKRADALDQREAALAVALVRAPNAAPSAVVRRACAIQHELGTDCADLDSFVRLALARPARSRAGFAQGAEGLAPHFARRVFASRHAPPGTRLRSTLDAGVQRIAAGALRRTLTELARRGGGNASHIADGAVVVLDNASGAVLAWVGSSGGLSAAPAVDAVLAPRQAGSTLKPFLYASAFDDKRLTAASLLDDSVLDLPAGNGLYVPQNYDRHFRGWVSARTALASSLNIPAVRTLMMVTPERFARQLRTLGLPLTQDGDYYGYSLALGSADVTLLSLSNAYRALARGGVVSPTVDTLPAAAPHATQRVFSDAASFVVADILSDRQARLTTFGLDSVLDTSYFTAVKTGTSKDMRDNWTVGFSRRYTVGVWVGNADGAPMRDVSGVSGAGPIWRTVFDYLHTREGGAAARPAPPRGVVRSAVHYQPPVEPARDEWFLNGTVLTQVRLSSLHAGAPDADSVDAATALASARIAEPVDGTLFALDPDIPPANQRLSFDVSGVDARTRRQLRWRLDGQPLPGGVPLRWLPWPGRHRLSLTDGRGRMLDEVGFEVRGAFAKARPGALH